MSRLARLRTYARLGPANIARVAAYRLGLRLGVHPVRRLAAGVAAGPFFRAAEPGLVPPAPPNTLWNDAIWRFGWHRSPLPDGPPDWFANPFSDHAQPDAGRDWWAIPDFGAGDIKGLWELSRFDWAVAWATCAAQGDDGGVALARLNAWLADWAARNPPYRGPNWKCGQEASIRVLHLAVAAWVLGQDRDPLPGLVDLLAAHLQRIAPTLAYAVAQQNNHATSEAAALFIGGSLLAGRDRRATGWMAAGRRWLEDRAARLIEADGTFSQYSVVYHRLMLDTYALAEAWRRRRGLPAFSDRLRARLAAASRWLEAMTCAQTGDAPNLGANDGARLIPLGPDGYRDFRPSVALAAALFEGRAPYGPGPWEGPGRWLGVPPGRPDAAAASLSFDDGGFHVLRAGAAMAVLRYPRFRFRPGQADALHLDLWHRGENLLRDAGTYSYNADGAEWFAGTAAHCTVAFDGRDQMPRLGRFLFSDWLAAEGVETVRTEDDGAVSAAAAYVDGRGARHARRVQLAADGLICTDTLSGRFAEACLRWRLAPGAWVQHGAELRRDGLRLAVHGDGAPVAAVLAQADESRFYQHRDAIPVFELRVDRPCTLVTRITF